MTTTPRKPQDRRPKSAVLAAEAAAGPAGAEFLKSELAAWDQADATAEFLELFEGLGIDLEDADAEIEIKMSPDNVRFMGQAAKLLLKYADDADGLTAALSGPGALNRGLELAMWFFGQLGEGDSSAS
jgi:hypothetical protein